MYSLKNISKIYNSRRGAVTALDNISLDIERGSFVTITGNSGSGKSTLLLMLGGLIYPTSGQIEFGGKKLFDSSALNLAEYRSRNIGFVLQTFNLIPYLSASENIMLPMLFNAYKNGDDNQRAESLLARVGLNERAQHLPRELSVGQQQRVAIARALANDPEVILADEPTGNLDPGLSLEILEILKDLNVNESKTIIMVTHSPDAAKFGNRHFRLKDGLLID
jgi:putative ABC transport system ATP-binding protein